MSVSATREGFCQGKVDFEKSKDSVKDSQFKDAMRVLQRKNYFREKVMVLSRKG